MTAISSIAANLASVRARLDAAAKAAGHKNRPRLIAVSKTHDEAAIRAAIAAGQRDFGENRVQEAQKKFPALKKEFPDLVLHLIGPLQSNKTADAVALFDVIHTLDRPKLVDVLIRETMRQNRRPDCLIQVNTGEESQKAGIAPEDADAFIAVCRDDFKLPIIGLMCIPPVDEEPSLHFALLAKIAKRNGLAELSMGMSHDFEIAAAFGATMVRVGTAIFGKRAP